MNKKLITLLGIIAIIGITLVVVLSVKTTASNSGTNGYSQGCSCHSSDETKSLNVTIEGLPEKYKPGEKYILTIEVDNTTISENYGGFEISVSNGTFTEPDENSKLNNEKSATHNNKNSRSWLISWVSPSYGDVIFKLSALVANGDGSENGDEWNNITKTISLEEDKTPPEKITGLKAEDKYDGKIELKWNKSTENDFKEYRIYFDIVDFINVNGKIPNVTTTINSYTITGLKLNTIYYFAVTAVDKNGNEDKNVSTIKAKSLPTQKTTGIIKGTVKDKDGNPIIRANVMIADKTTITDENGNYSIQDIPQGMQTLKITKDGYKDYEDNVNIIAGEIIIKDVFMEKKEEGQKRGFLPAFEVATILISIVIIIALLKRKRQF